MVASGWFKAVRPRDVVIIAHDGMEKIKRIERVRPQEVYVLGDNAEQSTDSRDFGWLPDKSIRAKILWPRVG